MLGAVKYGFGKLIEDLENQHTQGMKAFPSTLSSAFGLIKNTKIPQNSLQRSKVIVHESDGIANAYIDENKKFKHKTMHPFATISCFKCQEKDHDLHSCSKEQSDIQMLLDGQEVEISLD